MRGAGVAGGETTDLAALVGHEDLKKSFVLKADKSVPGPMSRMLSASV